MAILDACQHCVLRWYGNRLGDFGKTFSKDSKSLLQEWAQAHKFPLPSYNVHVSGKPHRNWFFAWFVQLKDCLNKRKASAPAAAARNNWLPDIIWINYHENTLERVLLQLWVDPTLANPRC